MSMVFDANKIGRKRYNVETAKITLDLPTLNILCRYILQDTRVLRMEHLVNMRRLLSIVDRSTYENDPEKTKRINFIGKVLDARLGENITDLDLILLYVNGGINFQVDFLDYNNLLMDKSNVQYCHKMVEDILKYSFFYNEADALQELITRFKTSDVSKRVSLIQETEQVLDRMKNKFRKTHVEDNVNDVYFSLENGTFESAITDTYNMITNPSRRLYTGMQGFNELIGGGFESGRVYMLLGVAGVGKSLTLLNLIKQIKKYNPVVRAKDPTKIPCIVLLTMENTVVETITRLFDMSVENSHGMGNYDLNEVIYKLRNEGELTINDSSPLDIVIKYKANRSISTDYLYTLYDDLLDQGKEIVCLVQDHIKRIRSIDGQQDIRLELGDIVNEFKVFAADKDIPVITISHLNREATRILEESARKGTQDNGKLIGKSNTGESLLMIDNLDCGITITRDYDKDGLCYMTFHRIKMRDKGSAREYIAQPFLPDNPIRLVTDVGGIPQFKESLHNIDLPGSINNNSRVRMSGASGFVQQNDILGVIDTTDLSDNAFGNKNTYNLAPVQANYDNPEYKAQTEAFDEEISGLIIEEYQNREAMKNAMNNIVLMNNVNNITPTVQVPIKPFDFITCPIEFIS